MPLATSNRLPALHQFNMRVEFRLVTGWYTMASYPTREAEADPALRYHAVGRFSHASVSPRGLYAYNELL